MKNLLVVFLVGLFLLSNLNSQIQILDESGWSDSTTFKQEKLSMYPIKLIKYSTDGSKFFTFSNDNHFNVWNTRTGVLEKTHILKFSYISQIAIHKNDSLLCIVTFLEPYTSTIYIYNYIQDSIISTVNPLLNKQVGVNQDTYNSVRAEFNESFNQFISIISGTAFHGQGTGSYFGFLDVWDINTGMQISSNRSISLYNLSKSYDKNYIFLFGFLGTNGKYGDKINYRCILYDLIGNKSNTFDISNENNDNINLCAISYDNRYAAILLNRNILRFYDLNTNQLIKESNLGSNAQSSRVHSFIFARNSSECYYTYQREYLLNDITKEEYSIRHWSFNQNKLLDSINFSDPNESWLLDISPDSKYLIGGGRYGKIRIWEIDKVMSTPESQVTNPDNNLSAFPNPTNDEMTIKYNQENSGNVRLSLSDLFGQEVAVLTNEIKGIGEQSLHLNISDYNLPSGIYFIRYKSGSQFSSLKVQIIR